MSSSLVAHGNRVSALLKKRKHRKQGLRVLQYFFCKFLFKKIYILVRGWFATFCVISAQCNPFSNVRNVALSHSHPSLSTSKINNCLCEKEKNRFDLCRNMTLKNGTHRFTSHMWTDPLWNLNSCWLLTFTDESYKNILVFTGKWEGVSAQTICLTMALNMSE